MVARTLEAKLTARLLAVIAPALVAVGAASVALTWWALDAADTEAVRARVETTAAAMHTELIEPDPFPKAAKEVLFAMNKVGASVIIVEPSSRQIYESKRRVPAGLAAMPGGACGSLTDAEGERWRACASKDPLVEIVAAVDVTAHVRVVRVVGEGVALGILLALLAAAIAARTSLGGALASVRELVEWSERVVDTDQAPPAPLADTREIARLATSFDALVRRLVDAIARARATSENIAHELRTPLTTIRAELEVLASSSPAAAAAPVVERLRGDVDRLARVVDAILILATPQGPSRAADCVVNLADVARELASPETQVEAPDEALVVGEPRLVELAIANLLENARKHTGREARAIRVVRGADVVRVAVIDHGPGLNEEARARMFDRYWRASDDGGGTGLGLALVRAVAKRHGGEADARTSAGGMGLEVGVTFGNVVGWHEGDEVRPAQQ